MKDNNVPTCSKTISEVSGEWLSMERLVVKRSSYAKYLSTVRRHIEPSLGKVLLTDLSSAQINTFIYDKLTNGRLDHTGPLSAKTVRDIYTILKSIIKYAENEYNLGIIARNTVLPKKQAVEYQILTSNEQQRLGTYLRNDLLNHRKTGMLLCLYTGLRLGEICALRWQDIDFKARLLNVRHTLQRVPITENAAAPKTCVLLDSPKSAASVRTIPLTQPVVSILKELRAGAAPEAFVLTNRTDCIEPRNYQYFFHKTLQNLKLRTFNFHILRHTFIGK